MPHRWEEIRQLAAILEAEAEGQPVDCERAHNLADHLRQRYPGIARTMSLVQERFSSTSTHQVA